MTTRREVADDLVRRSLPALLLGPPALGVVKKGGWEGHGIRLRPQMGSPGHRWKGVSGVRYVVAAGRYCTRRWNASCGDATCCKSRKVVSKVGGIR